MRARANASRGRIRTIREQCLRGVPGPHPPPLGLFRCKARSPPKQGERLASQCPTCRPHEASGNPDPNVPRERCAHPRRLRCPRPRQIIYDDGEHEVGAFPRARPLRPAARRASAGMPPCFSSNQNADGASRSRSTRVRTRHPHAVRTPRAIRAPSIFSLAMLRPLVPTCPVEPADRPLRHRRLARLTAERAARRP